MKGPALEKWLACLKNEDTIKTGRQWGQKGSGSQDLERPGGHFKDLGFYTEEDGKPLKGLHGEVTWCFERSFLSLLIFLSGNYFSNLWREGVQIFLLSCWLLTFFSSWLDVGRRSCEPTSFYLCSPDCLFPLCSGGLEEGSHSHSPAMSHRKLYPEAIWEQHSEPICPL